MNFSTVIPVLNESAKLAQDVQAMVYFLKDNQMENQIIVIDDMAKSARDTEPNISKDVLFEIIVTEHRRKSHAIHRGIKATCGDYVMLADIGECAPYT
jgi:cellulose synthase/poly-beta-1,6-N-acetylglucosamine synthase-like glycosyltransferase